MSEISTALEVLPEAAKQQVAHRMSTPDDETIRRLYRIAESLYQSGIYADVKQAGQAFAKLIVGRDLGLTPARAMSSLYFVKGQVQIHYATLGAFVRENGFEFAFGTGDPVKIRAMAREAEMTMDQLEQMIDPDLRYWPIAPSNESVTICFFGRADESGFRRWLGDSTFDMVDAHTALLDLPSQSGAVSMFVKYPRNMLTARALSNGVRWFCPEALGGIPIYVEDEVPQPRAELTAGSGEGSSDVELSPKIEELIAEAGAALATEKVQVAADADLLNALRAISDRATVVMTLGKRSPAVWAKWEEWARQQIDRATGAVSGAESTEEAGASEPVSEPTEADSASEDEPEEEVDGVVEPEPVEVPAEVQALMDRKQQLEEQRLAILEQAAAEDERPLTDDEREVAAELEREITELDVRINGGEQLPGFDL